MVIVPNSIIGKNEVVNYTYPDPVYRIETHVSIPYDTDVEVARRLLVDAVRGISGVLSDRPVEALYIEMAESSMVFRVRWWVESYIDTRRMIDRVHTAVHRALSEAGIKDAYPTQNVNLRLEPEMAERLSGALKGSGVNKN
jgi:small-conductance mechanosensitive channel